MARCVGMLLAFPGMAAGQADAQIGVEVLALDQAVAMALQQNRQVQIASLDIGKTEDRLRAAKTYREPSLQVGLSETYTLAPIDLHFKRGDFGTFPGIGPVPAGDTIYIHAPSK